LIRAAQPAKTALFAGGNGVDVRKTLPHLGRRRLFPMNWRGGGLLHSDKIAAMLDVRPWSEKF
jgi:hypothetical protein